MTEINDLSVPIAVPERPLDYMTHILAVADAEVRKLRHDPWDMFGRAVQPVLWLVLFGEVMARVRGIASDGMLSHNAYAAVAEGNCVPQSFDLRGGRFARDDDQGGAQYIRSQYRLFDTGRGFCSSCGYCRKDISAHGTVIGSHSPGPGEISRNMVMA